MADVPVAAVEGVEAGASDTCSGTAEGDTVCDANDVVESGEQLDRLLAVLRELDGVIALYELETEVVN